MLRLMTFPLAAMAMIFATMTSPNLHADDGALSSQLMEKAAESKNRMPAEMLKTFSDAIDTVRETGIEASAKNVGDMAPDATLQGWDGKTVMLSDLWKQGPVVLMWYRGGWCPYCNVQLRAMQQSLSEIEGAGAKLVVLTPELPAKAKETAGKNDLEIVALHDANNQVAKDFGILFDLPSTIVPMYRDRLKLPEANGNDEMALPLAATYVIATDGKISYAFLDADYKKRAEPSDVIAAAKAAN